MDKPANDFKRGYTRQQYGLQGRMKYKKQVIGNRKATNKEINLCQVQRD